MKRIGWIGAAWLLVPAAAWAHPGHGGGGFAAGLAHPVLGFDHLLAMVSVGILSAQMGGRAIWSVPATFVGVMLVGGILGMLGVPLVSVELGIGFSVVALGLALAAARRLPVLVGMVFVGIFALFHGHAHGAEMPVVAKPVLYAAGFVTGTASLHVSGVLIGLVAERTPRGAVALRLAGVAIALTGITLLIT